MQGINKYAKKEDLMWEISGIPFWEVIHHEILHCFYSLLFLLVIYSVSRVICWLAGWDYVHITSMHGFLWLGLLVSLVLVSHYIADELWAIIPLWVSEGKDWWQIMPVWIK